MQTKKPKVCKGLYRVDWIVLLRRLAFHDNAALYKYVYAKWITDLNTLVPDRNEDLLLHLETTSLQLIDKCILIDRFQQPGTTKRAMNHYRRIKDYLADLILIHLCVSVPLC